MINSGDEEEDAKMKRFCVMAFICIGILSCNGGKPVDVTFDTLDDLSFTQGMRISIEGYFAVSPTVSLRSKSINALLFEKPESKGKSITANIRIGDGPNHAEKLPRYYTEADLHIHTNKNEIIGAGRRVRITGKRYCHGNGDSCYIMVETVEKIRE